MSGKQLAAQAGAGTARATMLACGVLMAFLGCGLAAQAQHGPDHSDDGLLTQINSITQAHHGKVAFYARQLNTQHEVEHDSALPVQTASVIKLAMLYEAMVEVREGKAHWDEKITLKPGEPVGGSGMLTFFDTPLTVTLKDVLTMMAIVSDNTATNMAIDRFGVDAVNARMEALGLKNTHFYKKVMKPATGPMPADQPKFGLGKTTPYEIATLITRIGKCQLHADGPREKPVPPSSDEGFAAPDAQDKAVCEVGLHMLKSQFYRETIPRYLPNGGDQTVASKTGSLNAVRVDVALVAGKTGPMVLAIFTYDNVDQSWTVDNEGEVTIAKLAKVIVNAWSPEGLDAKTLVSGLGLVGK